MLLKMRTSRMGRVFSCRIDNRNFYPVRSWAGGNTGSSTYYNGRTYLDAGKMSTIRVNYPNKNTVLYNHRQTLEGYLGGGQSLREVLMCPFVKNEFATTYGDGVRDIGNIGNADFPYKQPQNNTAQATHYVAGYWFYFETIWKNTRGMHEPMRRMGKRWKNCSFGSTNGTDNQYCNVVASDRMRNTQFGRANANHPTDTGTNTWWTSTDGGGGGWVFSSNADMTSASYLADDGSVIIYRMVNQNDPDMGGSSSRLVPVEYFRDNP
jgi:hypothetical protein